MKHTAMTILYEVYDNLYINLTNKCPCACTFCLRQTRDEMDASGTLWLTHEPSYAEVIAELEKRDMDKYKEIVFCGFGEPNVYKRQIYARVFSAIVPGRTHGICMLAITTSIRFKSRSDISSVPS